MPEITFDSLVEPLGRERFFSEYFGKAWVHIKGSPELTKQVMTWSELNRLISMRSIWTPATMRVMLDRKAVATDDYCTSLLATGAGAQMRPDMNKLGPLIRRGVSIVLNDINTHAPGVAAVCDALQDTTGGQVQSNLYFSMRQRQAFGPHNDTHDVYALHCCGEKVWQIYENKEEWPIAHPRHQRSFEEAAKMAGKVAAEVKMEPGDLLYLPRGQFHDALASQNGSVHIAFGVTMPKMIDLLSILWEAALVSPTMRKNLPTRARGEELAASLAEMAGEVSRIIKTPQFLRLSENLLSEFRYDNTYLDLESLLAQDPRYQVNSEIRLTQVQGKSVLAHGKEGVEVPGDIIQQVAWVMGREDMTDGELAKAFPAMDGKTRQEFISNLLRMNVLR